MTDVERIEELQQTGRISAAELLELAEAAGAKPKKHDLRVGRLRAECEIEDAQVYLAFRDVGPSATLRMSPEDCAALGAVLIAVAAMSDGRAGCYLVGTLEVFK